MIRLYVRSTLLLWLIINSAICWASHLVQINSIVSQASADVFRYTYHLDLISGDDVSTWYLGTKDKLPFEVVTPTGWTWAPNDTPFNHILFITGVDNGAPGDNPLVVGQQMDFTILSRWQPGNSMSISQDVNDEYNDEGYMYVEAPMVAPSPIPEPGTVALLAVGLARLIPILRRR